MAETVHPTGFFNDITNTLGRKPNGDIAIVRDGDAVKVSLLNLLLTSRYERPSRPNIGAGLRDLLFELDNASVVQMARVKVREAFEMEPRATLVEEEMIVTIEEHTLHLVIPYFTQNINEQQELDFILEVA